MQLSKLEAQDRFQDLRFGMFIVFGLYSQGKEYEWHQYMKRMKTTDYIREFHGSFDPDPSGMEQWVITAKEMGAKYIIVTTKHHDGFCLWDSKIEHPIHPNYHIRSTPFWQKHKRSIIDFLFEAGQKHGIQIGLYYSTIDWSFTESEKKDFLWFKRPQPHFLRKNPVMHQQYVEYSRAQIFELARLYPDALALWFDGYQFSEDGLEYLQYPKVYEGLTEINPGILVANNSGQTSTSKEMGRNDLMLFENSGRGKQNGAPWPRSSDLPGEVCLTINNVWGYAEKDKNYKKPAAMRDLVLYNTLRNSNTLLNFGPTPEGFIAEDQVSIAKEIGSLLKPFHPALYLTRSIDVTESGGIVEHRVSKKQYCIEFSQPPKITEV